MLKLGRVTKVKVLFLVLVFVLILTYLNFRPPFWRRVYLTGHFSQCDKFLCFLSVDSDEDDEEDESHSSREVCCLPFLGFG